MLVCRVARMIARLIRSRMELLHGLKKKSGSERCSLPSSFKSFIHWLTFAPSASSMESGCILLVALRITLQHKLLPSSRNRASLRSDLVGSRWGGVIGSFARASSCGAGASGALPLVYYAMFRSRWGLEVNCDCGHCGTAAIGLSEVWGFLLDMLCGREWSGAVERMGKKKKKRRTRVEENRVDGVDRKSVV